MTLLERAILIAVKAHAGQKGKDGAPYILHPLRLMAKMETEEERITAVLHDVAEDTDVTFDDLRSEGFSPEVMAALKLLTHEENVSYEDYVKALKPNPLAYRVKIADLEDNSNIRRVTNDEEQDLRRLKKYRRAWRILKE